MSELLARLGAHRFALRGGFLSLPLIFAGCQLATKGEVSSCQVKCRSLEEQSQVQLAEIANLKQHSESLEGRLREAETALAESDHSAPRPAASASTARINESLVALTTRFPSLAPESDLGGCRLQSDALFDAGATELRSSARTQLDRLAGFLRTGGGRSLRVVIVGYEDQTLASDNQPGESEWRQSVARAGVVAEYLAEAGIGKDRISIMGQGTEASIARNEDALLPSPGADVFVFPPDAPLVGWRAPAASHVR